MEDDKIKYLSGTQQGFFCGGKVHILYESKEKTTEGDRIFQSRPSDYTLLSPEMFVEEGRIFSFLVCISEPIMRGFSIPQRSEIYVEPILKFNPIR